MRLEHIEGNTLSGTSLYQIKLRGSIRTVLVFQVSLSVNALHMC